MEFAKPPEKDPSARRRLSAEAMLARDEQLAALCGQGVSLPGIGARLGMSLASVQLAMRRVHAAASPSIAYKAIESQFGWVRTYSCMPATCEYAFVTVRRCSA
jgi:hypothetical protein